MALKWLLLAAVISSVTPLVPTTTLAAQDTTKASKEKKDKKEPKEPKEKRKPGSPKLHTMPSPEKLAERKKEADELPLFKTDESLPFTLIANYKALFKDRDTLSTKRFPARLVVANASGVMETLAVQLRTRGHYRLNMCGFAPLRVLFPKNPKGTPFEGEKDLKLGTHCARDNMTEQYVLREYLAYRIHALVSPFSFRVRLAKGTYVDSATLKPMETRQAMFVESEEHMAARHEGVVQEMRGATFDDVDAAAIMNMTLFEYMIGNTDWSMYALHNVRLVQNSVGTIFPVAYDFDFSGLVGTRYSIPDPKLPIRNVKERLFRGPCKSGAEWAPVVAPFKESKAQVMALYDNLADLDKAYAREAKEYLDKFYDTLNRANDFRGDIIDNCNRKNGA